MRTDGAEKINLSEGVYMRHYGPYALRESAGEEAASTPRRRRPVVICPGGGYRLISATEAWPVAERFASRGFYPFILNYTVLDSPALPSALPFDVDRPGEFGPVRDVEAAISTVKSMAGALDIDEGVTLCGFSAGAHAALAYCALRGPEAPAPAALILSYPAVRYPVFEEAGLDLVDQVKSGFPPTFIWHGQNDHMVDPKGSFQLADRLLSEGAPFEFHSFGDIRHADPFYEPAWFDLALAWLNRR
jgi:acetyl esterase/lipase